MKLVLDTDPEILTVRRYAPGEIEIAGQVLRSPCIVSAQRLITDWQASAVSALDLGILEPLLELQPRIILLGSDAPEARAATALRRALEARGIALEVMNLGAACRTYNVLAQELRAVVAGLFPCSA
jgi:uncharacterized protein